MLNACGIFSVKQMLEHYPFRYENYQASSLTEAIHDDKVTLIAQVFGAPVLQRYGRKTRLTCKMVIDGYVLTAIWFNRHFLKQQLIPGRSILLIGKWNSMRRHVTVSNFEFCDRPLQFTDGHRPVYSICGKMTQHGMRKLMMQAIKQYRHTIDEILPRELIHKHHLMLRSDAIQSIHTPRNEAEWRRAHRRFVYEEFFLFQLKIQALRALHHHQLDGTKHTVENAVIREFVRSLPFELTQSQKKVQLEILHDMRAPYCMNRLLQGDVGCGKTIIAAIALFCTVRSGFQGALMAPTEMLAEQHFRNFLHQFEPLGIKVDLLTSRVNGKNKKELLAQLREGKIHIIIGTHALIQEEVSFHKLGLVVMDEQHRFGVNQRAVLRKKGYHPDVLTMTATPIPRTLAMTLFGDMDISIVDERPKGRIVVKTYWVKYEKMNQVFHCISRQVEQGRQVYVICPLIEQSETLDVQNVIDFHAKLNQQFSHYRIGIVHGRMSERDREQQMKAFYKNEVQLLVSTTVVEVGIDVPNATLIIIVDADRFGLSQLHQLRGRVGRGDHNSYCILVANPKSSISQQRMKIMTQTSDGFELSRRDLEIRGPGQFFGMKQSGLPEFKVANMAEDFEVLEHAREDAIKLVNSVEFWTSPVHNELRDYLDKQQVLQSKGMD